MNAGLEPLAPGPASSMASLPNPGSTLNGAERSMSLGGSNQ